MHLEDRLQAAAARSVSIMCRYHDAGNNDRSRELMVAEVQLLVGYLQEFQPQARDVVAQVLEPVESYLLDHYGHEVGLRLERAFVEAVESTGMSLLTTPKRFF